MKTQTFRPLRLGVFGAGRGKAFMDSDVCSLAGFELVAVCDKFEPALRRAVESTPIAAFTDFDEFIRFDMDAVVLANYFNEHAPYAVRALRAGKHVLSETASNATLAEGVALCRAVEEAGLTYMLAENYPFTAFNLEMKRLYDEGEIGRLSYAEGEYLHPISTDDLAAMSFGENHWRFTMPATYYCTHSLAPLMYIGNCMPVKVNGFAVEEWYHTPARFSKGDAASAILCRMDNGALFKIMQGVGMAGHSNFYRLHGTKGAMELARGEGYFGPEELRVWHEEWNNESGGPAERRYKPTFREHAEEAARTGHGGGDFFTMHHFGEAIRSGEPPFFDVYRGVACSSVGILAWKSVMSDGNTVEMPDFRSEADRKRFENDHFSPYPEHRALAPDQPPSSKTGFIPSEETLEGVRAIWKERGYRG